MGSNKQGVTEGLLRKSVQQTLATPTVMGPKIQDRLFNNQNSITMPNISQIQKMSIIDIIGLPELRAGFITVYNIKHNSQGGAYFFDREIDFVKKLWADNSYMKTADPWSLYAAIMNIAYYGLSVEPIPQAQAYIYPRHGNKLIFDISPYGGLALRIRGGSVVDVSGPHIVVDGDSILINEDRHVVHTSRLKSSVITGAWLRVYKSQDRKVFDDKYFSMEQILSYRPKGGAGNSLAWTGGIDGQPTLGMIIAKVLKHGLASYPLNITMKQGVTFSAAIDDDAEAAADAAYAAAVGEVMEGGNGDTLYEEVAQEQEQQPTPPPTTPVEVVKPKPQEKSAAPTYDF